MRHYCVSLALLVLLPLVAGCGPSQTHTSKEISDSFIASGRRSVDLAKVGFPSWERVCILGPYMQNREAKETLGFEWDVESNTTIASNEGISLLLFVQSDHVVEHVEHPRSQGDFSNLTMQCYPREQAVFYQIEAPRKGWSGLFHEKDT
jgi:hypothetical protein